MSFFIGNNLHVPVRDILYHIVVRCYITDIMISLPLPVLGSTLQVPPYGGELTDTIYSAMAGLFPAVLSKS